MRVEVDGTSCRWEARLPCQGDLEGLPSAAARLPDTARPPHWSPRLWFCPQEKTRLRTLLCPLFTQDLFFKYTWNNFLHFQVELCIGAILSHASREDGAEAGGPESVAGPPAGNGHPETPQSAASHPESTMVMHVSPARVQRAGRPVLARSPLILTGRGCATSPLPRERTSQTAAELLGRDTGGTSCLGLACRGCGHVLLPAVAAAAVAAVEGVQVLTRRLGFWPFETACTRPRRDASPPPRDLPAHL